MFNHWMSPEERSRYILDGFLLMESEQKKAQLSTEIVKLNALISDQKKRLAKLEAKNATLAKTGSQESARAKRYKEDVANLKNTYESKIKALENEVAKIKASSSKVGDLFGGTGRYYKSEDRGLAVAYDRRTSKIVLRSLTHDIDFKSTPMLDAPLKPPMFSKLADEFLKDEATIKAILDLQRMWRSENGVLMTIEILSPRMKDVIYKDSKLPFLATDFLDEFLDISSKNRRGLNPLALKHVRERLQKIGYLDKAGKKTDFAKKAEGIFKNAADQEICVGEEFKEKLNVTEAHEVVAMQNDEHDNANHELMAS